MTTSQSGGQPARGDDEEPDRADGQAPPGSRSRRLRRRLRRVVRAAAAATAAVRLYHAIRDGWSEL